MRIKTLSIMLIGLVIQSACGEKKANAPSEKGMPVKVIAASYEAVPAVIEAPGTVQARNRIALSSQINGFVREMRVRVGDSVQPGQILARLDARDAESQQAVAKGAVDEAQAALSEARKAYQSNVEMRVAAKASRDLASQTLSRYQKLFESRSVSPQELDEVRTRRDASAAELGSREAMVAAAEDRIRQIEARISQAKAQGKRTEVMMSWTEIKAPSAGKVVERPAENGSAIFPGTPLVVIESTADPQVLADLPAENAGSVRAGMKVNIRTGDQPEVVEGTITEIAPLSNPATHTIQFKVDLPSSFTLSNGHFVKVEVPIGTRNSMLVPRSSIREAGQLTGLFVVDSSSKARFRLVKIAPGPAAKSEVLSGVASGEYVITDLNDRIIEGAQVEIQP